MNWRIWKRGRTPFLFDHALELDVAEMKDSKHIPEGH